MTACPDIHDFHDHPGSTDAALPVCPRVRCECTAGSWQRRPAARVMGIAGRNALVQAGTEEVNAVRLPVRITDLLARGGASSWFGPASGVLPGGQPDPDATLMSKLAPVRDLPAGARRGSQP